MLLPVRDGQRHLAEALASLARQTVMGWELVAVDDGSQDDSPAQIQTWADDHAIPLTLVRTPPRGVAAALRTAVEHARTDALIRMDADDVCLPRRFELQLAALAEDPGASLVACQAAGIGDGDAWQVGSGTARLHAWQNGLLTDAQMKADLYVDAPFPHSSVVLRRSALQAAGGYLDHGWPEDYDLWHRLARDGARFAKVAEPLLQVRDHPARVTRTHGGASQEALLQAKLHYLLSRGGPLHGMPAAILWGAGRVGKRLLLALQARSDSPAIEALIDLHPRKLGKRIHGVPVLAPDALMQEADLAGLPILAAVGKPGAREDIRRRCAELGAAAPLAMA